MKDPDKKGSYDWLESFREVGPLAGLGMQIAFTMVFFVAAGYLLDRWADSLPWFTLAGSLLGITSIFVLIFRVSSDLSKKDKSQRPPSEKHPGKREIQ